MTYKELYEEILKKYSDIDFYVLNKDKTYHLPTAFTNNTIIDANGNEYAYSSEVEGYVLLDTPRLGAYSKFSNYDKHQDLTAFDFRCDLLNN